MSDTVAVVSGGTGGLGRAVVPVLLGRGWRVHVPYRSEGGADELRAAVGDSERLTLHQADLADPASVEALFAAVDEADGRVDVLCNLVGGFAAGSVAETDYETWARMWSVNATAPFLTMRAAVPLLARAPAGRVVNVATAAGLGDAVSGMAAYVAAKSALVSLTKSLARELGPRGIAVNAVAPPMIDTPAARNAMPDADRSTWITGEEIAGVILFLAGPDAAVVTGNVLELEKG